MTGKLSPGFAERSRRKREIVSPRRRLFVACDLPLASYTVGTMVRLGKDTTRNQLPAEPGSSDGPDDGVYFFPEQTVTEIEVRTLLREGTTEQRAWVVTHLLKYAQWDDIWTFVARDEVREILPHL